MIAGYLSELPTRLTARLGDRVLGAWVIGAGVLGDFDAAGSDVDVQAVSAARLPSGAGRLAAALCHEALPCSCTWPGIRGLREGGSCRPSGAGVPARPEHRPGDDVPGGLRPNAEPRLWFVLDVAVAREHSALWPGSNPRRPAALPPQLVSSSLSDSLDRFSAHDAAQPVLAACRAWAWAADGRWLSKGEAANWAAAQLDTRPRSPRRSAGAPIPTRQDRWRPKPPR